MERSVQRRREGGKEVGRLELVAEACEILRALLKHKASYPLKPGGLLFFEKLRRFDATLQKCLEHVSDPDLARLQRITGRWREFEEDATRVSYLYGFVRAIRSHWWGLFYCYDHDWVPRTNNTMESLIGSKKQAYRRITGRQHWGRYILRFGMGIFMGHGLEEIEEIMVVLEEAGPSSSAVVRELLERNRAPGRRLARIRGPFEEMMLSFEAEWVGAC